MNILSNDEVSFPTYFDSTLMSDVRRCHRLAYWAWLRKATLKDLSPHLVAGGAYAAAHDTFRKLFYGEDAHISDALRAGFRTLVHTYGDYEPPEKDVQKNWYSTAAAFLDYYREYPPGTDIIRPAVIEGHIASEFSFSIPFDGQGRTPRVLHPETGEPIIYSGRLDAIMEMGRGLAVYDDKTTKALGDQWAKKWQLRGQFTGYVWGAQEHGYPVSMAIVRGAGMLKTKITWAQAIVYKNKHHIVDWLESTAHELEAFKRSWAQFTASGRSFRSFPMDLDEGCVTYGGCEMLPLCDVPNPEPFVKTGYHRREWNPIDVELI